MGFTFGSHYGVPKMGFVSMLIKKLSYISCNEYTSF